MAPEIPADLKSRVEALPNHAGVYLFKDKSGAPIYIGKALSIRKRVLSHFRSFGEHFSKEGVMLGEARTVDFVETPTEAEALLLEASLVKEHQPKYNQLLKDDKSYPFLKITNEEFPRLLIVRGRKADGGKYFGPFTEAGLLRQAVDLLRRLFPMRTCSPMPDKVCLMYHIGQCKGPCVGEIDKRQYGEIVKELELFLKGRREALVKNLVRRMKEYSEKREYEKAKAVYEEIQALSAFSKPKKTESTSVLNELMDALFLPQLPIRIEAFDISNIMGKEAVGSMVVFVNGKPARSEYRRFRIKTVEGIDDYEMMREVVRRRYTRVIEEKGRLPDLVLIDGGKGHLAAAKRELALLSLGKLPVISIAKQRELIFSPEREAPYIFPQSSPILHLVQRVRDEAHRFAITFFRRLHKKVAMTSLLDDVPGVGPKTRERLLKTFGSVARIRKLSADELVARGGIPPKT
ncbi:MAG: excinuclease ABC subunit UvrC, partial [Candidatus Omnitrophota bacterium]